MKALVVTFAALAALGSPASTGRQTDGWPADPRERTRVGLVLRLPGQRALDRLIAAGQTLAPAEIGRRYGLPERELERLRRRLAARDLELARIYPHRGAVGVRGTVGAVSRAFQVSIREYAGHREPVGEPVVPFDLRDAVVGVAGLGERPIGHALAGERPGLQPVDVARAYDIEPLWRKRFTGRGESVAVVSFAAVRDEDIALFDTLTGTTAPLVERIPVFGGTTEPHVEAALDVQVIRSVAPGARILVYETSLDFFPGRFGDVINEIVAQRRARIVSVSYGRCDDRKYLRRGDRASGEQALRLAAASGVSVFIASGDQGAYDCQGHDWGDQRLTTSWPGDSPSAVSVGGTLLSLNPDRSYRSEAGWEDILSTWGSGGGLNPLHDRPAWQSALGLENRYSTGRRQVPDVAGPADPDSPFFVVFRGQPTAAGGTSAAAPFWAGVAAIVDQYARAQGVGPVGSANALLYGIAKRDPRAFHDVTRGGNRYYDAGRGWDYATGLGSPRVERLARAAVAYLEERRQRDPSGG